MQMIIDSLDHELLSKLIESHYDLIDQVLFNRVISNEVVHSLRELNHSARKVMNEFNIVTEIE